VVSGSTVLTTGGQWSQGDGERSSDEGRWEGGEGVRHEQGIVDSSSGGPDPETQRASLKSEAADPESQSPNLNPQGSQVGRRTPVAERLRREMEMSELKRAFEEKIKAGNALDPQTILDLVSSTAKVAGIPLPHFPRSP
jgi:hypothetical protein